MRLVKRDVEVANPQREIDPVEVVEGYRKRGEMREEEDYGERRERLSHRQTGRSRSASLRLPRR